MKKHTLWIMALYFITFLSGSVFAANGNKGDWGFETKAYKYALIEGKVISINPDKKTLTVEGFDEQIFYCEYTEFYQGDITLPMERVFHPVKFNKEQRINAADIKAGDIIKARYSRIASGKIYLDTCLVGEKPIPLYSRSEIIQNMIARN
ncbi:MAG: hypothetical protein E3K37_17990 [Candidatus Kuenenia sp.]|nr:hypothetical protein [Candidatus Kuenenia hertensis]